MKILAPFAIAFAVAGCAGPAEFVKIDGYKMMVRKHPNRNLWTSGPVLGSGQLVNPTGNDIYNREVRAIEAVSGCPVMKDSVYNTYGVLDAAVDCSVSKTTQPEAAARGLIDAGRPSGSVAGR